MKDKTHLLRGLYHYLIIDECLRWKYIRLHNILLFLNNILGTIKTEKKTVYTCTFPMMSIKRKHPVYIIPTWYYFPIVRLLLCYIVRVFFLDGILFLSLWAATIVVSKVSFCYCSWLVLVYMSCFVQVKCTDGKFWQYTW